MLIRTPHQNALTQTIKSASLGTPISVLAGACVVCDVVYMPRDVFPIQIRMIVFVRTRLCANAEIGVPRGRPAFPCHTCSTLSAVPALFVIPASPSVIPAPPSVIPASPSVIPAKAGILIRLWTPCFTYHPDPHQRFQDIQTQKNPYFQRLSRVADSNSMTLINSISR